MIESRSCEILHLFFLYPSLSLIDFHHFPSEIVDAISIVWYCFSATCPSSLIVHHRSLSPISTRTSQRSFLISVFAGTHDLSGPRTGSLGRDPDLDLDPRNRASQLPPLTDPLLAPDDEDTVYDSRGQRISARHRMGDEFVDDVMATTRRFRARVAAMNVEDELEAATSASQARRSASDLLENAITARKGIKSAIEDAESSFKKRSKLFDEIDRADEGKSTFARWTKLVNEDDDLIPASAAASRAKQTKARLHDLQSEMDEIAERQAKRERRTAALRALVNETVPDTDIVQQSMSSLSKKVSVRSAEKSEKHVSF